MQSEFSTGEIYFIIGMMVLILMLCVVAMWAFFRTYRKEMREKAERQAAEKANTQADIK